MKKIIYFFAFTTLMSALISCKDKETNPVIGINLDKTALILPIGGTTTITATIIPNNATNKTVIWTSNNSSVVDVTKDTEEKGLLSAKTKGTAIITAATKDGKFKATCTIRVINAEPEMIQVESGTFTMGCTDGDCGEDGRELPIHKVTLSNFKIAKYTVTQEQWEAIMGNNPSKNKGNDLPVEMVTWNDTQEFIKRLNTLTGKKYRLPTEAEWEYAARGGKQSKEYKYSGSDDINSVAWYSGNSGSTTHPVGRKAPNELGICDMSGNVWEWCSDWYGAYSENSQVDPTGPTTGTYHVFRGGSYYNTAKGARVASRTWGFSGYNVHDLGFRLVLP